MDEAVLRGLFVLGAVVVVALVLGTVHLAGRKKPTRVRAEGFTPGVYLFTSATCLECGPARASIVERLGEDAFTEVAWEADADAFARLGVTEVPATLVVDAGGRGRLYRGVPDDPVRAFDP